MESKTRFTPGPWRADITRVYAAGRETPLAIQDWWDSPAEMEEAKANAALIAAAPEMYALLEKMLDDWMTETGAFADEGWALLDKARGEVVDNGD